MVNFPDTKCLRAPGIYPVRLHLREAIRAVTKEPRRQRIPVIASMETEALR